MATGVDPALIRHMPLFEDLTDQEIDTVARKLYRAVYNAGTDIMRMEEPGETTYVILEGSVKIVVEQPDGTCVILAMLGPGEVVGELGVIQQAGRSATVTTLERSALLWMHRTAFHECIRTMPAISMNLLHILAGRLRLANKQTMLFATQDVYGRVARILLAFAREYGKPGENGEVAIPLRTAYRFGRGTVCYVHPERETGLSCTACERPICAGCMVHAPVGQLCKRCAAVRKPVQYRLPTDKLAAGALAALLGGAATALLAWAATFLPILALYLLLLAVVPTAALLTQVIDRFSRGRRGKRFQIVVGVAMVVGALPLIGLVLFWFWPLDALWMTLFVGAVAYSTMLRLR